MLPYLTLKADAIKLGVYCFVAGIIVGIVLQYLRQRYNQ
jgi:F0F1-type ATP synthase assembly protein I